MQAMRQYEKNLLNIGALAVNVVVNAYLLQIGRVYQRLIFLSVLYPGSSPHVKF